MSKLKTALALAEQGFYVFPLVPGDKPPAIAKFPERASRDAARIERWWQDQPERNIGIYTGRFFDTKAARDRALIVVDVDEKNDKRGGEMLAELDMLGYEFPDTLTAKTPTNGRHLFYAVDEPLTQGVENLGRGLDTRSYGGYVVAAGSEIEGQRYKIERKADIAEAPAWLIDKLGKADARPAQAAKVLDGIDPQRAKERAIEYLKTAPISEEGQGGDNTAYVVACRLKDYGLEREEALELLVSEWNHRCEPPWPDDALSEKVNNAYRYGKEPQGSKDPGAVFHDFAAEPTDEETPSDHPVHKLNNSFAFITNGSFVLQETTDDEGAFKLFLHKVSGFRNNFANITMTVRKREQSVAELWLEWNGRRTFEDIVFVPEQPVSPRFYNLWRGFKVAPAVSSEHDSVGAFRDHALKNVCNGDRTLCHWLIGYFAHLIQRPWEKPLVALVFKGKKGTGKNALLERVGWLLGLHFVVADDQRYLLSNFNSHMESNLFFVLDEACWAGDKRAEGKLKGLITGSHHIIERKGMEPRKVRNLSRVAIIGNEDWLVPASEDERRFAVFGVGDGRMQDRKFFHDMRVGMENGGYAHLLRFLLDYDLTGFDPNAAPSTDGLKDQKLASLGPLPSWWHDCLIEGQIVAGGFSGGWPERIATSRVTASIKRYAQDRQIRSRLPDEKQFRRELTRLCPSLKVVQPSKPEPGESTRSYEFPALEVARAEFCKFLGHKIEWEIE